MQTTTTNKVKMQHDIVHYLPCVSTNKRVRGWQQIKKYDWGHIDMRAFETITATDIFILIAAVKAFQDNNREIIQGQIVTGRQTVTLKIPLARFMKHYLHIHNKKYVVDSFKRLTSYQIFFHSNNGDVHEHRYLMGFDIKDNILSLTLNKRWYDACTLSGLTLHFNRLIELKSNLSRMLFIYISGHRDKRAFYQDTLELQLSLEYEPKDNRKAIIKAFKELQTTGEIVSFTVEKKVRGYLFSYVPAWTPGGVHSVPVLVHSVPVTARG